MSNGITKETMQAHRARWFVYAGGEKIPHTATMRGQWGYDVECSCGMFETRTGGGTRRALEDELWSHRWEEQAAVEDADDRAIRLAEERTQEELDAIRSETIG